MPTTPGIITWNRLEPRPRTEDFDRTLRAEVRDALWMMTRQWQFGEYQAEDTGSAIFSRVQVKKNQLNKLKLGNNSPDNIQSNLPLEAAVEKEVIEFDFLMRLEMSRYWERMIGKKIRKEITIDPTDPDNDVTIEELIQIVIGEFRKTDGPDGLDLNFYLPADDVTSSSAFYSNPELWHATAAHTNGRAFDGYEFFKWLQIGVNNPTAFITADLQVNAAIETAVLAIISEAKNTFINWFNTNYAQPSSDSAWNAGQLEYQFSTAAPRTTDAEPETVDVLVAEEYYHGSLDWYTFEYEKNPDNYDTELEDFDSSYLSEENFTLIPSPVKFAGMPNPRWWEMEDRKVDLGDVNPSTSDTAKIIYAEFGLIYSNDWMIFPHTVEAGSLCEITNIVVTDCFGQETKVVSANGVGELDDDWKRWSFFGLSTKGDEAIEADPRLFIPPVAGQVLESDPIESINFIRDEMANMVWGIEKIVPNGLGAGVDGYETSLKHVDFLKTLADGEVPALIENDAVIKYTLANSVPENWIPFVPKKLDDPLQMSHKIQLQRAALPRYIDGLDVERIRPKTTLLQTNFDALTDTWNPYFIHENEVPRAGAIVKRTWQRTRTENGTVVTWVGRRKTVGRGEGSSNLSFDNIEDK